MRIACPPKRTPDNPDRRAASTQACVRRVPVGWALRPYANRSPAALWQQTEAAARKEGWKPRAKSRALDHWQRRHTSPETFRRRSFLTRCRVSAENDDGFAPAAMPSATRDAQRYGFPFPLDHFARVWNSTYVPTWSALRQD